MNMSDAQERCIEYHLWKSQGDIEKPLEMQDWQVARLNVDKKTASDIIKAFKDGNCDMAVNQIKHLCQTLK